MEPITEQKETTADRLEKLGFKRAAQALVEAKTRSKKLMLAYEFYRFVREEHIRAFQNKLARQNKFLQFTAIEYYNSVPPAEVLEALERAHSRKCFDGFEVAHIVEVKDPILFGRVIGCTDRFFIAEWDEDVKLSDLINDHQG